MQSNILSNYRINSILSIFALTLIACQPRSERTNDQTSTDIDPAKVHEFLTSAATGKALFARHCITCHTSPERKVTCQQTFDRIFERYPDPGELYFTKFIQNSKALKATGDPYAKKIDEVYKSDYEHHFVDTLTEQDIEDMIVFIKATYY